MQFRSRYRRLLPLRWQARSAGVPDTNGSPIRALEHLELCALLPMLGSGKAAATGLLVLRGRRQHLAGRPPGRHG